VLEQLDRQNADVIERFQRPRRDGGGLVGKRAFRAERRGDRQAQDAIAVGVFDERPERGFARAAARREDRQLARRSTRCPLPS
jgi:hypothetical protein